MKKAQWIQNAYKTTSVYWAKSQKAKFLAVGARLTEFEQEFMAHLIVKGKDGQDTTIDEQLLPQYHKHIEGKDGPLLLN